MSREVLNLFTILFIIASVAVFSYLGLSPSVAAFIAGLLVGQTLQHYHIFSQIRPLRDLFAALFFVSLGAQVTLGSVFSVIVPVMLLTFLVLTIKIVVTTAIFVRMKFHTRTSFSLGVTLSQVGEFAFIIIGIGFVNGIVSEQVYLIAISTVLITLASAPLMINYRESAYNRIKFGIKRYLPDVANYLEMTVDREPPRPEAIAIKDHIIVCGYGRVGKYVGRALEIAKIPYMAIDYNYYTVSQARRQGVQIIYGDPSDIDILEYAQVKQAFAIVAAVPLEEEQEMIVLNAKTLNPRVIVFSRVGTHSHEKRMKALGANIIIQPEFEASVSIAKKIYQAFNMPEKDIVPKIKRLKLESGMS